MIIVVAVVACLLVFGLAVAVRATQYLRTSARALEVRVETDEAAFGSAQTQ